MTVSPEALRRIYVESDDPWNFATSAYEQEKFRATRDALLKPRYLAALELGCGNGELARHIAPLCDQYTGVDGAERALAAARRTLPDSLFMFGYLPQDMPDGDYDLIILSEILYFLGKSDIDILAATISNRWPTAELLCVTYLGETEQELQGDEAFYRFVAGAFGHHFESCRSAPRYRIDRGLPELPS